MVIREGLETDVEEISNLWLKMVDELSPESCPNVNWWKGHLSGFLKAGNYFVFVAQEKERIIGFIDFFLFPEPATSKIHCVGQHLYVLPEYRRTSVAGNLWKTAIKFANKNGAEVFELCCFGKEEAFWRHHGFIPKRMFVRRERRCF